MLQHTGGSNNSQSQLPHHTRCSGWIRRSKKWNLTGMMPFSLIVLGFLALFSSVQLGNGYMSKRPRFGLTFHASRQRTAVFAKSKGETTDRKLLEGAHKMQQEIKKLTKLKEPKAPKGPKKFDARNESGLCFRDEFGEYDVPIINVPRW